MKTGILFLSAVLIIVISCNKDKFTTIPQVKVKSITPTTVVNGNVIIMKAEYTDKEGDLDSILVVYKWFNGPIVVKNDTFRYSFAALRVPAKTDEADMSVTYTYNLATPPFLPGVSKDTTATLGLILKDKEAHRSNYSESKQIRLIKP